eukprot:CAMPEP_0117046086 /NCGR_PEP_ID=MMETSP0472-20121206/31880_1 /TAXON_ID=693140 ORGANISM="Tiarina fusus, Strain LIS" /NCGR_SAMPLE_ID=MMETSP0472 /ASSEMBLY_ACC=CAM_ASM_000603 /LENGTH=298 /DNA_ID=CAMNT_0004758331 /DNA_START=14 /DNA_END=910 /DNA_ORIENTATION=+
MDSCVIKTHFADDIRRFTFPLNGQFEEFQATLSRLYSLPLKEKLNLHYIDDEGDLVSITSQGEFQEAMFQANSLLRVFVTKKLVMNENAPLYQSWVMLKSLVNSESSIPTEQCKEAIKEVKKISEQVRTCEQLLQTPEETCKNSNETSSTNTNTPTGDEPVVKTSIKDIVQNLSKEIAKKLAETSETITKLITQTSLPESEIAADINDTAGAIIKILGECSTYSNEILADVRSSSNSILDSVHKNSDNISALLAALVKDESIATLRAETISACNSLSSSTVQQCLKDSDDIRDLIMRT